MAHRRPRPEPSWRSLLHSLSEETNAGALLLIPLIGFALVSFIAVAVVLAIPLLGLANLLHAEGSLAGVFGIAWFGGSLVVTAIVLKVELFHVESALARRWPDTFGVPRRDPPSVQFRAIVSFAWQAIVALFAVWIFLGGLDLASALDDRLRPAVPTVVADAVFVGFVVMVVVVLFAAWFWLGRRVPARLRGGPRRDRTIEPRTTR